MSDGYLGEIRMFGANFAPIDWALCHGQQMMISENRALFSLIGTIYGGDGRYTFNLPDLRSRLPMGQGTGLGLTPRRLGSMFGVAQVTLTSNQLPSHSHKVFAVDSKADKNVPDVTNLPANVTNLYSDMTSESTVLDVNTLADTGGDGSHNNLMSSSAVSYIICVVGDYPSRS